MSTATRGRPVTFHGKQKRTILAAIRRHGLTGARIVLGNEQISISLPTLSKFANEAGIVLKRGRQKKHKDSPKVKKAKSKITAADIDRFFGMGM